MLHASKHIESKGIVPTEPASPTSKHLFFYCLYTSLPISSFTLFLSFSLSHRSFSIFFTLPTPPPPSLPEALSSELPRFFIKELSLKPSNYYGERENTEREEEGTWGEKSVFHCFTRIALSVAPIPTHIQHFSLSPSHTLKVKRHRVSIAYPPLSLSLSVSVSPIPSDPSLSG